MSKNTGGPALRPCEFWASQVVTLRDYFAAKAMQTLIQGYADCNPRHFNDTAGAAYKMADAMLEARK